MEGKRKMHRDVGLGILLLVFCAAVFAIAVQIKGEAAYVPMALPILMAICALSILINGLKKTKKMNGDYGYKLTVKDSKAAFTFIVYIAVYYLLFKYVCYWVATPIFMLFAQKYLKVKSWKVNILVTVIYTAICFILFVVILKLPIYKVGILGKYFRIV